MTKLEKFKEYLKNCKQAEIYRDKIAELENAQAIIDEASNKDEKVADELAVNWNSLERERLLVALCLNKLEAKILEYSIEEFIAD